VITEHLGLPIYATPGTAEALKSLGIPCTSLGKGPADGAGAVHAIEDGKVDLVINIPREYDELGRPDGYWIRRRAVDAGIPLLTDLQLARAVIEALRHKRAGQLTTLAYDEYLSRNDTHEKPLA
jgi:carbamoyl-phosphate synthase large subunit